MIKCMESHNLPPGVTPANLDDQVMTEQDIQEALVAHQELLDTLVREVDFKIRNLQETFKLVQEQLVKLNDLL